MAGEKRRQSERTIPIVEAGGEVTEGSPTLRLELDSRPETLTLLRGVLAGIAEPLEFDPELLDDLKTAVSEACNNVVMHAYDGRLGPLRICLYVAPEEIEVVVRDEGKGISPKTPADERLQGVGMPVMQALTKAVEFHSAPGGGTEVRMHFAGERDEKPLFRWPGDPVEEDRWVQRLAGEAVVSVSPVSFVGEVLGRLARALAARARFSLDRFSDIYLVTDTLAAYADRSASRPRLGFGISTDDRRLDFTVGPFRKGTTAQLRAAAPRRRPGSALELLSDELEITSANGGEALHLVMIDRLAIDPTAEAAT